MIDREIDLLSSILIANFAPPKISGLEPHHYLLSSHVLAYIRLWRHLTNTNARHCLPVADICRCNLQSSQIHFQQIFLQIWCIHSNIKMKIHLQRNFGLSNP